jgi:hypothetical protein
LGRSFLTKNGESLVREELGEGLSAAEYLARFHRTAHLFGPAPSRR